VRRALRRARTRRKKRVELKLVITAAAGKTFVPFLRRHLKRAHRLVDGAIEELSLALVNDRQMSDLHLQFLGIRGPTDVLTFELDHDQRGNVTAGEVIVCVPEARRQSPRNARRELLLYALHGMLHLSGFDDKTAATYTIMHRKEDEILEQLGVGRVFAPAVDRTPPRGTGASPVSSISSQKHVRLARATRRSDGAK
jgi:rRNA maturation RNase YbeY